MDGKRLVMPPEIMITRKGRRIVARPDAEGVVLTIFNIEITLTVDESQRFRDLLIDAEMAHERGAYFNEP